MEDRRVNGNPRTLLIRFFHCPLPRQPIGDGSRLCRWVLGSSFGIKAPSEEYPEALQGRTNE